MDSLVKPRPNHYELLGVTPSATDEEVARAFAREISPLTPHAFGDIALLSVAHETLRDPARRRAYDESIGLKAKPVAPKPLQGWQYSTTVRLAAPVRPPPPPPVEAEPPVQQEATPEPPAPAPAAEMPRDRIAPPPVPPQRARTLEDQPAEWRRPAIIGGGIFLGVGLLGVLAGLWAARDVQSKIPSDALEISTPAEARALPPPAPETAPSQAAPARTLTPPSRARHKDAQPAARQAPVERAEDVPEIPTEQVAALASQAGVTDEGAAAMPLSNAVIARTIRRIGYSCGDVVSTAAVDSSPGAFKVTCSSGQSYRAAPVRGRYHFRRWAG